ncbi:MAG TPA: hypothetical protein VM510_11615 [Caulifigura sp.]|nr:hypothetical protein [Caulifigura sp.]
MAHAYTPGLLVSPRMRHRVRRVLPISGDVLVQKGATVKARDVVARTFMPGDITPVNIANQMSLSPSEVGGVMLKRVGDQVAKGEILARSKGMFGLFKTEFASPASGTIESISDVTGQLMIRGEPLPVQVLAYVNGVVVDVLPDEGVVVEAEVAFAQGIFGVGGEAFGTLKCVCASPAEDLTADKITSDCRGAVVVGGARIHEAAVRKAAEIGVAAIIGGGIDDADLKAILGYDLGVAITGSEKIGLTLIITEGFGDIAMADRTFTLLRQHAGADVSVNGATQIRAGVMRPEIVIPVAGASGGGVQEAHGGGILDVGSQVRIIRDPYFGVLGKVTALPHQPAVLGSGSTARVLEVACADGQHVTVPRANVVITGG